MRRRYYDIWMLRRTPVDGNLDIKFGAQGMVWSRDEVWRLAIMEGYSQTGLHWSRPKADPGAWHLRWRGNLIGTVRPQKKIL